MKLSIFPKDPKFFKTFEQQADLIVEICKVFHKLVHDYSNVDAAVQSINDIEHKGDEVYHELMRSLNLAFVTPIDREDIHLIGSTMDDVLDLVQGAATRLKLYKVGTIKPGLIEMADIMPKCAEILRHGIQRLPDLRDISDLRKPLHELERQGDQINRQAVAELFEQTKTVEDVVSLIKWKEIIENVEDAIDKFEDVFDVIESVLVKHA